LKVNRKRSKISKVNMNGIKVASRENDPKEEKTRRKDYENGKDMDDPYMSRLDSA